MSDLHHGNRFGWEDSVGAWVATVDIDANRTHLLDPLALELIGEVAGLTVLDVGCGEGRFARRLADQGALVVGVDPIASMLTANGSGQAQLLVGDAQVLPIASKSVDVALAYLSLIDVPDFRRAIREMTRVLRPGGRLIALNVHPMASAIPGWKKNAQGDREYYRVDRYFEERGEVAAWNGIRVFNWHRPVQAYMEAFLEGGLMLERFVEPQPSPEQYEARPNLEDQTRVPNFIAWAWRKPC